MSCFSNLTAGRSQRQWHALLVVLVVGSLTISVATRYSDSGAVSAALSAGASVPAAISPDRVTLQSIDLRSITLQLISIEKHSKTEPGRQRLLKNAAAWNPPVHTSN